MSRTTFLRLVSAVAMGVGLFALLLPNALLASKGVTVDAAARVWVREVGVLITAQGVMAWLVRHHPDSPTLRAFLIGSALVQLGLFPIEILAWDEGVITRLSGIVPNSIVHLVFSFGFLWFARNAAGAPSRDAAERVT